MKRALMTALAAAWAGGCGGATDAPDAPRGREVAVTTTEVRGTSTVRTPTTTVPDSVAPSTAAVPPSSTAPRRPMPAATSPPPTSPAPAPVPLSPPPATAPPVSEPFESSVRAIDDTTAARMTASWRPGCPVGLDGLRLLTVSHWGFDGRPRTGEAVVAARHADALVGVFAALFRARFPIEQMRLVDEYGADDDRSMAANNTSAFNCRTVAGSDRWSEHAYGTAIDVNPVQNPYVTRSGVSPPAGAAYTARDATTPGLITRDGPVVSAFAAIGWGWGGSWSSGKDYQHFSASGR